MPIGAGGIAAITAAGAVASQGYNAAAQGRLNLKNRQFAEHMYFRQREDALSDWAMQNEYNSPVEQMKRLKAAGLNSNLVYGDGANSPSATVRGSDFKQPDQTAPQIGNIPGEVMGKYAQSAIQMQELKNMKQTEELIKAQTKATLAKAGLGEIDLNVRTWAHEGQDDGFSLLQANELSKYQKASADASSANYKMRSNLVKAEIDEATKQNSIEAAAEKITQMRINNAKTEEEKKVLAQRLEILKTEGKLKELDLEFAQSLNKRWDGYILKILGYLLGGK